MVVIREGRELVKGGSRFTSMRDGGYVRFIWAGCRRGQKFRAKEMDWEWDWLGRTLEGRRFKDFNKRSTSVISEKKKGLYSLKFVGLLTCTLYCLNGGYHGTIR